MPRKVTLDGHVPSRRALWLLRREHPCWRNVKVRTSKYLNTSSSKTTAPSSDAARRWLDSNRSPTRRLRLPVSSLPTVFARSNSLSVVAVGAATGRARPNGRWHSHKNREVRNTKGIITTRLSRDAPEPDELPQNSRNLMVSFFGNRSAVKHQGVGTGGRTDRRRQSIGPMIRVDRFNCL